MEPRPPDLIRNVALIGHRGSGKTSTCEAILFEAGITTVMVFIMALMAAIFFFFIDLILRFGIDVILQR